MKIQFANDPIDLSYNEYATMPNVTLVLDAGHHWALRSNYHMENLENNNENEQTWDGSKTFVNRACFNEPNGIALDVNAMLGNYMHFDIENKIIVIAETNCSRKDIILNTKIALIY